MTNRWKSTAYKYRRLMPYALPQWSVVLLLTVLTVVVSVIPALQPWPLKILVDYALGDGEAPTVVRRFLEAVSVNETALVLIVAAFLCSLALFALETMLDFGFNQVWAAVSRRMVHELAADLFHHLQRHSLRFHNRRSVGDLLSRLIEDTWCVQSLMQNFLLSPAQHLLTLSAIGVVAWQLDPELAVLAVIVAPVLGGSALYFGPRLKKGARLNREAKARLLSFVHQTLTVIPIIQAFSTERRNRRYFQSLAAHAVALSQRDKLLHDAYGLINGLATTAGVALVLYAGSQRVLTGALSVGSLLVFLAYMRSLQSAAQGLLKTYGRIKSVEANIDRVLEVLDAQWEVRDRLGARPLRGGVCGHVRLEGVSFGYEPGRAVLQEVSLEAHPGETVALVGPTGAGKSTLVSLIPRFFDPWSGRVILDGVDVREVQLSSLRGQMAVVLQEPFLLPLTVAENIAYGRPGASQEAIEAVAVAANADRFIRCLPQGYATVIGERGATLSGGEKQRLAIARALLKDAPVLILDEPTSALDTQTEALVLEALERLMRGRTTFIIAHRLSTVRRADRIVVLEQGRVIEMGTHEGLMAKEGHYMHLLAWQFESAAGTSSLGDH